MSHFTNLRTLLFGRLQVHHWSKDQVQCTHPSECQLRVQVVFRSCQNNQGRDGRVSLQSGDKSMNQRGSSPDLLRSSTSIGWVGVQKVAARGRQACHLAVELEKCAWQMMVFQMFLSSTARWRTSAGAPSHASLHSLNGNLSSLKHGARAVFLYSRKSWRSLIGSKCCALPGAFQATPFPSLPFVNQAHQRGAETRVRLQMPGWTKRVIAASTDPTCHRTLLDTWRLVDFCASNSIHVP